MWVEVMCAASKPWPQNSGHGSSKLFPFCGSAHRWDCRQWRNNSIEETWVPEWPRGAEQIVHREPLLPTSGLVHERETSYRFVWMTVLWGISVVAAWRLPKYYWKEVSRALWLPWVKGKEEPGYSLKWENENTGRKNPTNAQEIILP